MTERTQLTSKAWKILQFPVTRLILASIWLIFTVLITQAIVHLLPANETVPVIVLSIAVVVLVAFFAYYAFVRIIEKRPVTELATSGAPGELAMGIFIGALLFTAVVGILWLLGYYRVTGINSLVVIIPMFALAVQSGVFEEILFRGIFFRIVEESLGTWLSLVLSALLFGLLHLANPNATLWAAIAIAIEAGILLAAAFVVTRRLWFVIGIHFAWNFTQGGIFSIAISGNQVDGLLRATLTGPELLSGGAFGAETSIFAVIICLATGIYFIWKALKMGKFVKPFGNVSHYSPLSNTASSQYAPPRSSERLNPTVETVEKGANLP